jgi:DNA-binding transcriptional LysR family regulator
MKIAETQYKLTASDLEVLLALVRAGNLAGAAKRLGADTSTVFRSIQRIEKQLGQTLFSRSRKGYFATDLTLHVVAHAEKIEAELEAARAASHGAENDVSGVVRLTMVDGVLYNVLMPHLPALAALHPNLQLELVASAQLANLTKRDADIAIRVTAKPPQHLVGHCLGRMNFAIYGAKSLVGTKRQSKPLDEYDWIGMDGIFPDDPVGAWRRKHFPKVVPRYRMDSVVAIGNGVRAGLGIAGMSTYAARHDPALVALTPDLENCSVQLWVLTHPESRHLRRISAVYNYIMKTIKLDQSTP